MERSSAYSRNAIAIGLGFVLMLGVRTFINPWHSVFGPQVRLLPNSNALFRFQNWLTTFLFWVNHSIVFLAVLSGVFVALAFYR